MYLSFQVNISLSLIGMYSFFSLRIYENASNQYCSAVNYPTVLPDARQLCIATLHGWGCNLDISFPIKFVISLHYYNILFKSYLNTEYCFCAGNVDFHCSIYNLSCISCKTTLVFLKLLLMSDQAINLVDYQI